MTTTIIRVPLDLEPARLFNAIVHELKFEPGIWDTMFNQWAASHYEGIAPISIQRVYLSPEYPPAYDATIEVRDGVSTLILPLEISSFQHKPTGYNPLTTPTRATPAVMPKKKPAQL